MAITLQPLKHRPSRSRWTPEKVEVKVAMPCEICGKRDPLTYDANVWACEPCMKAYKEECAEDRKQRECSLEERRILELCIKDALKGQIRNGEVAYLGS